MSVCELKLIRDSNSWWFYLIIQLAKEFPKKATTAQQAATATISKVRIIVLFTFSCQENEFNIY